MDERRKISTVVAGLDVGYGNLKAAMADVMGGATEEVVLPVGAARADSLNSDREGRPIVGDGVLVMIDGEEWGVGLRPIDTDMFERNINENYPLSTEYYGLFLAALAKFGESRIRLLVTGLPVRQFFALDKSNLTAQLTKRLQGEHYVNTDVGSVVVDEVIVLPQPMGGFNYQTHKNPKLGRDLDKLCLVIDVGFFSTDYLVVRGISPQKSKSGSNLHATSQIIELTADMVVTTTGGTKVSPLRIESALREGRETIEIGRNEIQIRNYLLQAANKVAASSLKDIANTLRNLDDTIDQVLLLGGGGELFAPAVQAAYPGAEIFHGTDSVTSNALGFLRMARGHVAKLEKAKTTVAGRP